MAKQAAQSILSTFNLSESLKRQVVDKPTVRRNKLLAKLDEQILAAQAVLKGEEYFGTRHCIEISAGLKEYIQKIRTFGDHYFHN